MRRPRVVMAGIIAVALAVRAWAVAMTPVITTDGSHYGALARYGLEGSWRDVLDPAWPPLFPWLVSLVARTLDFDVSALAVERAGAIVSVLAGTLVLWPTWELACRWRGELVAHIAILLLAFHPNAVRYSAYMQSDSLFMLLFVLCLVSFVGALFRGRVGHVTGHTWVTCAGLLAALAVLTRPEGWCLVGVLGMLVALDRTRRSLLPAFLVPVAVILVPWLVFLHGETGDWGPGAKGGFNFHHAHEELYEEHGIAIEHGDVLALRAPGTPWNGGDYRVSELVQAAPMAVTMSAFVTVVGALVDKLPSIVSWPLLLLAWFGFGVRAHDRQTRPRWLGIVVVLFAATAVLYSPFFLLRRFFLPFLPFVLIGAAAGIVRLGERFGRRGLAAITVLTLVLMVADTKRFLERREMHLVYHGAGALLRLEGNAANVVLAGRKPEPAFYGEAEFHRVKDADPKRLARWVREKQVTHFFLLTPGEDARLTSWLEDGSEPMWLTDRVEFSDKDDRLVLWRVDADLLDARGRE